MRLNYILLLLGLSILMNCDGNWVQNSPSHHGHNHNHDKSDNVPHDSIEGLFLYESEHVPDFLHSLYKADWRSTYDHMRDDDFVIGVRINNVPYAFPWWIMKNNHIANLTIEGVPIVTTLCEMCSGGNVYSRVLGGDTLTFEQMGLYKSSWFMTDNKSESYWLPFEGKAFHGNYKGTHLDILPSYQMYWHEWLSSNPDSKVMWDREEVRKGHGAEHSPGSDIMQDVFTETLAKDIPAAIPKFNLVLGVTSDETWKAYDIEVLEKIGPVLEDILPDSNDVVIFSEPGTSFCGAYIPIWKDEKLKFEVNDVGNIVDTETRSIWNVFGSCISGELEGTQLEAYPFFVKEWYGWYTYHPETEYYKSI